MMVEDVFHEDVFERFLDVFERFLMILSDFCRLTSFETSAFAPILLKFCHLPGPKQRNHGFYPRRLLLPMYCTGLIDRANLIEPSPRFISFLQLDRWKKEESRSPSHIFFRHFLSDPNPFGRTDHHSQHALPSPPPIETKQIGFSSSPLSRRLNPPAASRSPTSSTHRSAHLQLPGAPSIHLQTPTHRHTDAPLPPPRRPLPPPPPPPPPSLLPLLSPSPAVDNRPMSDGSEV